MTPVKESFKTPKGFVPQVENCPTGPSHPEPHEPTNDSLPPFTVEKTASEGLS